MHSRRLGQLLQVLIGGVILLLTARSGTAQERSRTAAADSIAAARTVDRFHQALIDRDTTVALELLDDSVLVLESGELETRQAYRAGHLAADVEFARAAHSERHVQRVTVVGDAAWVVATSRTKGEFRGRSVDSFGVELMVLRRANRRWRIAAIHWSSRKAPAP